MAALKLVVPAALRLAALVLLFALFVRLALQPLVRDVASDFRLFVVRDSSMAPALEPGSLAITSPARPSEIRPGDIISYRHPDDFDNPVFMRVVDVRPSEALRGGGRVLVMRRDAHVAADVWEAEMHGAVWRHRLSIPSVGALPAPPRWIMDLSLFGVAAAIGAPLLLYAGRAGGRGGG